MVVKLTNNYVQRRRRAKISGATLARGAAPGIGAAHMAEYVPNRHQPMIMTMVILSNQPRGGTQQTAAAGQGAALD